MLKTRLVGTEAVEVTDGQLDPKPGEGGERPDKIQPNRFEDQKTGNLIPFTFSGMYARCFTANTGQNLFQEDPDGRLANSRPTATKERTCIYPKSGMVLDIPLN